MKPKSALLTMLLAVLALFAAGCGDDDDETTSTTTTTSGATGATGDAGASGALPADVVTEGNEICAQGNKEFEQIFSELDHNANPEEYEKVVTGELVPTIQAQIDDIRALDDSEELQSTLDEAEGILEEIEGEPDIFIQADSDPFADVNDELTELGLTECAG